MDHLKAEPDTFGWQLVRNNRRVVIELSTEDMEDMEDDELRPVAELLRTWPKSSVALMYNDSNPDEFEARMARAVAIAMSELWPIVLDNYVDDPEIVYPPGKKPTSDS